MGKPIITIEVTLLFVFVAVIVWYIEIIFEKSVNIKMAVTTKIGVALYIAFVITCMIVA